MFCFDYDASVVVVAFVVVGVETVVYFVVGLHVCARVMYLVGS